METHGKIEMGKGYKFVWVLSGGRIPEISGHIEDPDGEIVKCSSGWYRTAVPSGAAVIARKQIEELL